MNTTPQSILIFIISSFGDLRYICTTSPTSIKLIVVTATPNCSPLLSPGSDAGANVTPSSCVICVPICVVVGDLVVGDPRKLAVAVKLDMVRSTTDGLQR